MQADIYLSLFEGTTLIRNPTQITQCDLTLCVKSCFNMISSRLINFENECFYDQLYLPPRDLNLICKKFPRQTSCPSLNRVKMNQPSVSITYSVCLSLFALHPPQHTDNSDTSSRAEHNSTI